MSAVGGFAGLEPWRTCGEHGERLLADRRRRRVGVHKHLGMATSYALTGGAAAMTSHCCSAARSRADARYAAWPYRDIAA